MPRSRLKDYATMYEELTGSSDRALGILAATYLEENLLDAIIDKLRVSNKKIADELVGNGSPLGTFSNKIMMAEAIALIGPNTRGDCDRIRKIRNECAHEINPIDFTIGKISDLVKALSPRRWGGLAFETPSLPDDPRKRYIEACQKISDALYSGIPQEEDNWQTDQVLE